MMEEGNSTNKILYTEKIGLKKQYMENFHPLQTITPNAPAAVPMLGHLG
jgi:hypothetical protein